MNLYVVFEGERGTKRLYRRWIPYVNSSLRSVDYLRDVKDNHFFLFAGRGQPQIWDRIKTAIEDVNSFQAIDRLVVAVDSEDKSYEEKLEEARDHVAGITCRIPIKFIIQHFCLETWLLANIRMFRRNPRDKDLIRYRQIFDVRSMDPEGLPGLPDPDKSWNRSQFAYEYLRAGIRDIHGGRFRTRKSYTKRNPGLALEQGYYKQVYKRCTEKSHIQSFHSFLDAFK